MEKIDGEARITDRLNRFVDDSGVITAMLITKQGTDLATAGDVSYMNTAAMAALIAGMFSATREVARIVGENQFSILLQQGEKRHIHISLVSDAIMLVAVFEDYQRIGRVRLAASKVSGDLNALLESDAKGSHADISVPQFKEYALNLIDRIFES
jgi:predicted regulator of Ras-like GTPase activity (Roadblock/LC7/MglB family)